MSQTRTFLVALVSASWSLQANAQTDLDLAPVTEKHIMIPMRDGQHLSAYLYFPPGDGPWPAAFEQRYADLRGAGTRKAAARLAEAGYVVAMVNFRGTYQSEGTWVGYRALAWGELQDGYDVCEWLATQPWCTGKIGTFGSSQGGYAQNFLAVAAPPHLTCQYMVDTGLSLFQEGYRIGGTTRPQRFQRMNDVCRNPADNQALTAEWFRHPSYDDYWRDEDCSLHFDKMDVPCFTIGSWYDFMNQGSIASFIGRQHAGGPNSRGKQQLLIGPWLHGRLNKGSRVGDLEYPSNATWAENDHIVRWFNHFLKGEDNGVEREPTVRYYVMGAVGEEGAPGNVWREADDFPPRADMRPLYLHAEGRLNSTAPEAVMSRTSYESDPRHPMEIPGTSFPGAKDARPYEEQSQVLTFTTEPLAEPVEWTGRIKAELYVSSTARDTDFIVRVSDVYPDGRSILLTDYPWRARYREGFEKEVLLVPGQVARVAFNVGWVSQIFNRGHRIRVTVASTGAPLYEPNPQTGEALTIEFPENAVTATNTIHHEQEHASRILAPIPVTASRQADLPRLPRDNLLVYRDDNNQPATIKTVDDWLKRRAEIVRGMEAVMGTLPGDEKRCPLDPQVEEEVDCGTYVRRLLTYASEPASRVPAYLCIPKSALEASAKPVPAVLCLHGTDNVVGHGTVVGLGNRPNRQYASELAERGYVTLAPNYPLLAKYQPDIAALGWESGTLKAVWDNMRGLDLLESLPYVEPDRFGAIGHSLGGHNSVYTSVFDDRIKVVVSSCGLDSYLDYYGGDEKNWYPEKGWCQTRYMLRLADYRGRLEEIPFDFHELIGALAPRHVLIIAPLKDHNFVAASVDRIVAAARPVFDLYGHPERLRVEHPDCEHDFPREMRETAYSLFDDVLR